MAKGQFGNVLRHIRQILGGGSTGDFSDGQLLDRFRSTRDADAFTALVERHGPMVHGVCCRILPDGNDADDAFQATFLVLARKADSIRRGDSVGGWLHGVAARVAARNRTATTRRRNHERQAAAMQTEVLDPQAVWPEVRPILDEELSRLPEKYRLPVVLRYLQGKSHEETAQELGCPAGTLSWRLSQARELLAKRLARRGVALSALVLETLLQDKAFSATLPPALTAAAAQAGLAFVGGQTGAGSPQAILLAEGVMKTMIGTRLKVAIVALLALGMFGGAWGALAYRNTGTPDMVLAGPNRTETKPEQPGGKEVGGLRLILTADKTETVMKADGINVDPINLKASFLNVSDKPIVLDHVHLSVMKLTIEVTPPDAEAMRRYNKTYPPTLWGPWKAVAEDFTEIKPGHRWSSEWLGFPAEGSISDGKSSSWCVLKLLKPGDYRVKLRYDNAEKLRYWIDSPIGQDLAAASWTGKLVSNELLLRVLPVGSAAAPAEDNKAIQQEKAKLKGAWEAIKWVTDGGEIPMKELNIQLTVDIDDETIVFNKAVKRPYTINPRKQPKTLDMKDLSDPKQEKLHPAIYQIEGDTLTLSMAEVSGKARPKEFSSSREANTTLLVYKRKKAE
jgi:RNA polymerase sigma factor (sigma-70 family)